MKKIYITLSIILASVTFGFSQSNKESTKSPVEYAERQTAMYTAELELNAYQETEIYDLIVQRNTRALEIEATTEAGSEEREAQTEYEDRKFMTGIAETLSDEQYEKWKEVEGKEVE